MDNDRHMDRQIRESFESRAPKAPEGVWQNLSQELDNEHLDQKLRESFTAKKDHAPESVWSAVERQLEIDRGWGGVRRFLQQRSLFRQVRKWSAAAMVLLLLSALWWNRENWFLSTDQVRSTETFKSNNSIAPSSAQEGKGPVDQEFRQESQAPSLNPVKSGSQAPVLEVKTDKLVQRPSNTLNTNRNSQEAAIPKANFPEAYRIQEQVGLPQLALKKLNWDLLAQIPPYLALNEPGTLLPQAGRSNGQRQGWHYALGLQLRFHRSWLANNDYRRGQNRESLIQLQSSYTTAYNLQHFLHWGNRHFLVVDNVFQTAHQQNFQTYEEGYFQNKTTRLNYWQIGLNYGYRLPLDRQGPSGYLSLQTGAFYGQLKEAYQAGRSGTQNLSSLYGADYGLQFSLGHELKSQGLIFAYGLQGQMGINNLYLGVGKSDPLFDLTQTRQWGFYLSLRYPF